MRVADLSPLVVRGGCVAAGVVLGIVAGVLTDVTAKRGGLVPLVTGSPRARRNLALVVLSALFAVGLAGRVLTYPTTEVTTALVYLGTNMLVGACFLAGAAVDLEHMILPNELMLASAVIGLGTAHFRSVGIASSLGGAVLGLAASFLPALAFRLIRKKSGMGLGDAKLSIAAGAWLGIGGVFFMLMAGALQSVLAAVIMRALKLRYRVPASVLREVEELRARAAAGDEAAKAEMADDPMANPDALDADGVLATRLPLGPFLVLAAFEFVFFGGAILDAFFAL